jgi:hypothetical protein
MYYDALSLSRLFPRERHGANNSNLKKNYSRKIPKVAQELGPAIQIELNIYYLVGVGIRVGQLI